MKAWIRWIVCVIFNVVAITGVQAVELTTAKGQSALTEAPLGSALHPITVGVMETHPYVYREGGQYTGLAVDLWEHVAGFYKWHYHYVDVGHNYTDVARNVGTLGYDIAIGNFSSTYERLQWVNFSPPYLLNNVTLLTYAKDQHIFSAVLKTFVDAMLPIILVVLIVFILASLLFWYLERKRHRYAMSESMFCTSIAMLSGNVIDVPSTNINRFVFICILITGVILQAVVIATITDASMRLRGITDPFSDQASLRDKYFIVEAGSTYKRLVYQLGGHVKTVSGGAEKAFEFYRKHADIYDGFVIEQAVADFYKSNIHDKNLLVSNVNLLNDLMVFFYAKDFPYQDSVSRHIYYMQGSGEAKATCERYLGRKASLCVL